MTLSPKTKRQSGLFLRSLRTIQSLKINGKGISYVAETQTRGRHLVAPTALPWRMTLILSPTSETLATHALIFISDPPATSGFI